MGRGAGGRSVRSVAVSTSRQLLGGIAFELVFAAALIYLPPRQSMIHTATLGCRSSRCGLLPRVVWGSDELRRSWRRRHDSTRQESLSDMLTTPRDEAPPSEAEAARA
jgi:hypothetical protein